MSPGSFLAPMAGIAILAAAPVADAQPRRVQVGTLSCSVSAGIGFIVASQRNVNCNFQPDNGPPEAHTGTMTIVGGEDTPNDRRTRRKTNIDVSLQ
jgi:hypothetical protein